MNIKKLAFGAVALALVACGQQGAAPKKAAAIDANSTDFEKFAYMLGAQFGGQNFTLIPRQMGEELNEDAVIQGIRDNVNASNDTAHKLQLNPTEIQEIGNHYTTIARKRAEEVRPDSATLANLGDDQAKIRAYIDSVGKAQPIAKTAPSTGAAVVVNAESSNNIKFSYLIGLQFANQLIAISKQFDTTLDVDYFILGVKESVSKVNDSTFVLQLPEDSLSAIGQRFQQKAQEMRAAAAKKFEEEQQKLKEEVAGMKGDTLLNGMPKLMNYKVKVSGISAKADDITAFANKSLLVFYFSATCGHCAHAAPQILEIAKEFAKDGLTTLAVASGGNNKSGIRKFMDNASWDATINVVWDESRQFGELYSDGYVPKVYLVNPDGTYKMYAAFESEKETLKTEIANLLKGQLVEWNPEDPRKAEEAKAAEAPAAAK